MRQLEFPENIQAIVGGKEYSLDNAVLKIWPESEETKGALCVEMEGVGLFTIANYRKCVATDIYVVSDVYSENDWKLGWEGNDIKRAVGSVIDMIIESIR
jgi:purine-nucleoside phosphorylase